MKRTLERLVTAGKAIKNSVKKNAKMGLVGFALASPFVFVNKAKASQGEIVLEYRIGVPYTDSNWELVHHPGAEEGLDKYDSNYYAMFDSSGIASKIISRVGENELDNDARPDTSKTEFLIELSLVSQSGGDVSISSPNELRVLMPLEGYTFGSQKLVLQQYDPDDPSEIIADYDVRELIEEGEGVGIIKLPDINGNHKSGEPYAYFKLIFK